MATRKEQNVATGQTADVPLTPEEEAAAAASSAAEAAAQAAANHPDQLESDCVGFLNGGSAKIDLRKVIKATVISAEAYRLGVTPQNLTGAQLNAIRNRIAAIYKAL
jgi:hypothetical protein